MPLEVGYRACSGIDLVPNELAMGWVFVPVGYQY
jgi:hypothetical protein